MTSLRLDRLSLHHTSIDTTIIAKEANKGRASQLFETGFWGRRPKQSPWATLSMICQCSAGLRVVSRRPMLRAHGKPVCLIARSAGDLHREACLKLRGCSSTQTVGCATTVPM